MSGTSVRTIFALYQTVFKNGKLRVVGTAFPYCIFNTLRSRRKEREKKKETKEEEKKNKIKNKNKKKKG